LRFLFSSFLERKEAKELAFLFFEKLLLLYFKRKGAKELAFLFLGKTLFLYLKEKEKKSFHSLFFGKLLFLFLAEKEPKHFTFHATERGGLFQIFRVEAFQFGQHEAECLNPENLK